MEKTITCAQCKRGFRYLSNLKAHVKRLHPEKVDYLDSLRKRKQKNYAYPCGQCHKNFTHQRNLKVHQKIHGIQTKVNKSKDQQKCVMCDYSSSKQSILTHYTTNHDILIKKNKMFFTNTQEFCLWKEELEQKTNSKFVIESSKVREKHVYKSFICHRSGTYLPEGKGLRHLKTRGTCKIGGFCPAAIKVKHLSDDRYEVEITETHVGHQSEIEHLNLTKCERDSLADKIDLKISFDRILDEVRDSICDSDLKRLHLLTKKDLYNIEQCYNLSSSAVRHANDFISVETWVKDIQEKGDAILFYKSQGVVLEEWPALKKNDFVLIIMTAAQMEMLKKYGSNCICIDGTYGTNSSDFELITLLVIDDIKQGFPCGFLISNRSDCEVLSIFFHYIKTQIGSPICPEIFMSDMADDFFNAWVKIMLAPKLRLYCTWHVDQAWRKNLYKIKCKEKQVAVYKQLRVILEERDVAAFNIMYATFYDQLQEDADTVDFAQYLKKNYMKNTQCWAYCHRLEAGLDTNMHLERMHQSLKYAFLKGKHAKRLDKGITAIMRMVQDKCIDRLIILPKEKLSKKLEIIRTRHASSVGLDINLITPYENGWNVSATKKTELCSVQKLKDSCDCNLRCTDCKSCLHQFSCSCIDSTIKYNMCKHIHLVCTYLQKQNAAVIGENNDENTLMVVDTPPDDAELRAILEEVSTKPTPLDLKRRRVAARLTELAKIVQVMNSKELDVMEKLLAPITRFVSTKK